MIQESFSDDLIRMPLKVDGPALPGAQEWNPTSLKGREGVQSPANLADQIPDSMTNHPHQHRFAILRHPDQVQVDLEYAVRAMTVLVHGPILPQRNAKAFA